MYYLDTSSEVLHTVYLNWHINWQYNMCHDIFQFHTFVFNYNELTFISVNSISIHGVDYRCGCVFYDCKTWMSLVKKTILNMEF